MKKRGRRGFYFTLDALFGILLIGLALTVSSRYFISDAKTPQMDYYSKDVLAALSNIKVSELNDTYVKSLISSGEIINLNNTLIEQIGEFYILNKTGLARNLSMIASTLVPGKYSLEILVNDESLYQDGGTVVRDLTSTRRLISGIEKFKPLKGATSKVYLESIKKKRFSKYYYFGGFVGQGNLTAFVELPSSINITGLYLEMDLGDNSTLFVNDASCASLPRGQGNMLAGAWNLSSCISSLAEGQRNNFTIVFSDSISTSYVGGGMIKVEYYTEELSDAVDYTLEEHLPGITGIVNLYSSFYVPGTLNNITLYLHYSVESFNVTNNSFYVTVGNATVYKDSNLTGEKTHVIRMQNITRYMLLSSMDSKTVPLRIGFENVTFGYIYEGNGDVVIVTDISGSMDDEMGGGSGGIARNCEDSSFNLSTTSRISVAKCLDIEFASNILDISGNEVGLVSYSTSTDTADTVYPTTDTVLINTTVGIASPESGYNANGYTCICCGINSARDVLIDNMTITSLISSGSSWYYNNFSFNGTPPQDSEGDEWYDISYANESEWFTGTAILGSTNSYSYSPAVVTEIGNMITSGSLAVNLSELAADQSSIEVDFTSGLSYTANTWGTAGNFDGWDSDYGIFGRGGGDIKINLDPNEDGNQADNTVATEKYIQILAGTGWEDSNSDCTMAAAAGVELNITQEMYDVLSSSNGEVKLYFDWYLDRYGNIDDEEGAWVKVQFGTDASMTYLGGNKDNSNRPYDASNEVYYCENDAGSYACPALVQNTSIYDLSALIAGPGSYYLILGGAADEYSDTDCDESFEFRFDNIKIAISNVTDSYYFRKHFNIADLDSVQRGVLNVLSDDSIKVYLNGNLVYEDLEVHDAEYWNSRGQRVSGDNFRLGDNVLAAQLTNSDDAAKFDLELLGADNSRDLAIMVMTDGQANYECTPHQYSTTQGPIDAVQAACDAREDYGITVYAVGYSDDAAEDTLSDIAACGDGVYVRSSNVTQLREFYQDVASTIVSASRHSQTIEISGNITSSILYPDSYILIDYTPIVTDPQFGEISVIQEEKNFDNCTFSVYIPPDVRVSEAKLTSYSSEHWTDFLSVNGQVVYNLSEYSRNYGPMGDPFLINIPANVLVPGTNYFNITTGDAPDNFTGCSQNNSFIYTAQLQASISYNDVLEKAIGCQWNIEFDDGGSTTVNVPPTYAGAKVCQYTSSQISYDQNDTYDDAMFGLLDNLDFDDDGRIYLNIKEENFIVGAISVGKVPYPWGPAIAEVRVWK